MFKRQPPKFFLVLFAALILFGAAFNVSAAPFEPETLSLVPGATASDLNFTWYSDAKDNGLTKVKFRDKKTGKLVVSADGIVSQASEGKVFHKAAVTGLKPNTEYEYTVSNDGRNWSSPYSYKTAPAKNFRFAFVADPQLTTGLQDKTSRLFSIDKTTRQGWQDTFAKIVTAQVNFIAGVGDQVDTTAKGVEAEYTNFFAPKGLKSIPFAPAVGNHDRHYLFQYHFNLPNEQKFAAIVNATNKNNAETGAVEAAGNYWYLYNNALFVVLNTSAYPDSAAAAQPYIGRFEQTLAAATTQNAGKYKWLFVQNHKSTASVAQHVADTDIQYYVEAGLEKLMDKYGVDFVLAGHDHVYARSYVMKDGQVVNSDKNSFVNPGGTIYLTATTGSGLKYYNIFDAAGLYVKDNQNYPYLVNGLRGSVNYLNQNYPLSANVALQHKKPGYTIIDVSDNYVTFKTYDIDSEQPIDMFEIAKF